MEPVVSGRCVSLKLLLTLTAGQGGVWQGEGMGRGGGVGQGGAQRGGADQVVRSGLVHQLEQWSELARHAGRYQVGGWSGGRGEAGGGGRGEEGGVERGEAGGWSGGRGAGVGEAGGVEQGKEETYNYISSKQQQSK